METSCRLAYSHCSSHHFDHAGAFDIQGLGLICGCTDGGGGRRLRVLIGSNPMHGRLNVRLKNVFPSLAWRWWDFFFGKAIK